MKINQYDIKVKIFNNDPAFGKGVVMLLDGVEKHGALSLAYKEMGMAASKAWKILHRAEADLGVKLVESASGGKKGGSSKLSEEGKQLCQSYHAFMNEVSAATEQAFVKYFGEENEKK